MDVHTAPLPMGSHLSKHYLSTNNDADSDNCEPRYINFFQFFQYPTSEEACVGTCQRTLVG